ncbi:MAG: arsenite methyltransferase [Euryarchaeota archaeon]|nr:arsenite methyltransferase [Euryarchaeota archaeon]
MDKKNIKKNVRDGYAKIATQKTSCCGSAKSCNGAPHTAIDISKRVGYTDEELNMVPQGANLGLGCGNPTALASLKKGEMVLDLGSGAGFDCFLAANKVGNTGKVIGVDMTPEMIDSARENAEKGGYKNVEFRLGEIENLPAADESVDVIISNCVINLSTDKKRVFDEAYRVLKPGGRIMVSDIVLLKELPDHIKNSVAAYVGCISGAIKKDVYLKTIKESGFHDIQVMEETVFPLELMANDSAAHEIIDKMNVTTQKLKNIENMVVSIKVKAVKTK